MIEISDEEFDQTRKVLMELYVALVRMEQLPKYRKAILKTIKFISTREEYATFIEGIHDAF